MLRDRAAAWTPAAARRATTVVEACLRSSRLAPLWRRRFGAAVLTARMLRRLDRRTDTRIDPSRAGRALLTAAPDALERLAGRLPEGCVLISAANGKTTTTNLLASIMTSAGKDPVVNHVGANMPGGICAELLARSGRGPAPDIGVFEVDELWLDHVVPPLAPRVIALGNLFRDQLDRMGEVDRVATRWSAFVERLPASTTLVVNADDPRVCQLAAGHPAVWYVGLDDVARPEPAAGTDMPECARCGARLRYAGANIGHLGHWRCSACGDTRPTPDVEAGAVEMGGLDGVTFTLTVRRGGMSAPVSRRVTLGVPGRYNVANAVLAAGAALALGVGIDAVVAGLERSPGAFGRAERLQLGDRQATLVLAKNPTGLDEVVELLTTGGASLDLLMLLNDRDLDGRDVSWIWDADLERLAPHVGSVTCGGARAAEAALRLDYAGIEAERIAVVDGIEEPLAAALARTAGPLVVIANYSAMLDLRETVAEQGHAARYWW